MTSLITFFKNTKYKRISFTLSNTQHLLITAKVNGVKGRFILDTGASNSCIGVEGVEKFMLQTLPTHTKAAGAGAIGMPTEQSLHNELKIGRWKNKNFAFVVFDLTHVNTALNQYKVKPVDGIIGADVLLAGNAIIDYANYSLFLHCERFLS